MKHTHTTATSKYPWVRDYHDTRDHHIHLSPRFKLVGPLQVPPSVDLRPACSPVENQGQIGSCTGHALIGAMEYLEIKNQEDLAAGAFTRLSRLFVYYNERDMEGTIRQDAGAQISDGIKALAAQGVCREDLWPYEVRTFAQKPSDAAYADAPTRAITAYARVGSDLDSIRRALASGYPIAFGFSVFSGFESAEVAQTGVLNMPTPQESNLGGHAVLMVGYDDASQRVIVRNSWGDTWGQQGHFTMPYDYVTNPSLAQDFWCITY